MSKINYIESNKTHNYYIDINDGNIHRIYFSHNDIKKDYTKFELLERIKKEIEIINNFLIINQYKITFENRLYNNLLQILINEAKDIVDKYTIHHFYNNNVLINKCYVILKYSSIFRKKV